ncbi:MAG TPA: SDR family oxidoreductase [Candidatus Saccharimonadales bacterium]|nr:SDR family oxidoreductase [Candidatus Saccharimonadales bacterium]
MIIQDKVVVITGSSSGIGKAIAELFAREGAKIVLNSRHNEKGGLHLVKELEGQTEVIYQRADVGTIDGAHQLLDKAVERFGHIDILINNAGVGVEGDFLKLSEADIDQILHDNLLSAVYCSQYAIALMQKHEGIAKIINTSSNRGWEFGARAPIYGLSKAGINSLTRTLAKNYSPNILVNAVAPGFTKTPNYDAFDPKMVEAFLDQTKLHRWIQVEEVAEAFLFLAKNDAITGEVIYVDAGFRLK